MWSEEIHKSRVDGGKASHFQLLKNQSRSPLFAELLGITGSPIAGQQTGFYVYGGSLDIGVVLS